LRSRLGEGAKPETTKAHGDPCCRFVVFGKMAHAKISVCQILASPGYSQGAGRHCAVEAPALGPRNRPRPGLSIWNSDRQVSAYRTGHMHTIPAFANSYCSHNERFRRSPPDPPPEENPTGLAASAGPPLAGAVLCATGMRSFAGRERRANGSTHAYRKYITQVETPATVSQHENTKRRIG
jgi:hypothetical protein